MSTGNWKDAFVKTLAHNRSYPPITRPYAIYWVSHLGRCDLWLLAANKKFGAKRQLLHAYALRFVHPITQKKMELTAELPQDMIHYIQIIENCGIVTKPPDI